MESLLTLSIGEFQGVSVALRVVVVLTAMTSALLALATGVVERNHRLPLILSAVGLGGAAWFERGVWEGWRDAFELAGTSYAVTGHLLADQDRIIAWSLGVPAILFSFGLVQIPWGKAGGYHLEKLAVAVLALAIAAPFSQILAYIIFAFLNVLPGLSICRLVPKTVIKPMDAKAPLRVIALTSVTCIFLGMVASFIGSRHSFGGGPNGELVRGEILRSIIDLFSLVIPGVLLLIGVLRLSRSQEGSAK